MADARIENTVTIVDPFDELSDIAAADERIAAGMSVLSSYMLDTLHRNTSSEMKTQGLQEGWLLLELIREAHKVLVTDRIRTAETAFFKFTDALAVQEKVQALRSAT